MAEYDLIVIGSGPAGRKAAISASKLEKRVAVVERTTSVGGIGLMCEDCLAQCPAAGYRDDKVMRETLELHTTTCTIPPALLHLHFVYRNPLTDLIPRRASSSTSP